MMDIDNITMKKKQFKTFSNSEQLKESMLNDEISHYLQDYVNKAIEMEYEGTEFKILQKIIQKQDTEINKLKDVIDRMAEKINQAYFDENNMYIWFEEEILPKDDFGLCDYKDLGTRKKLIKEYFMKEE